MSPLARRPGYTLLEVILAIAIVAVLLGLTLVAVQKVRILSLRLSSQNNLKQIGLAMYQFHDAKGRLPGVNHVVNLTFVDMAAVDETGEDPNADISPLVAILPYLDGSYNSSKPNVELYIRMFTSPGDPTLELKQTYTPSSYGVNICALETRPNFTNGFPDGVSNTIAAAERYNSCYIFTAAAERRFQRSWISYFQNMPGGDFSTETDRRPTFADRSFPNEVYPVTMNGVSYPTVPGQTFQVRVKPDSAWCGVPQTPFESGLPTLFFDGSVRAVRPGIDPSLFWGAVTRAGGEVLNDF